MYNYFLFSKKLVMISSILFCLILTGCQNGEQENEDFTILVFSSLPESAEEKMKVFTREVLGNEVDVELIIFPPIFERLVVEVAGHHGDLFILERELLPSIYDKEGFYSLENLRDETNTVTLDSFEKEAMVEDEQITEEIDIYENALRVVKESAFFHKEGNLNEPGELVAVIPIYAQHEETAFALVERLVKK